MNVTRHLTTSDYILTNNSINLYPSVREYNRNMQRIGVLEPPLSTIFVRSVELPLLRQLSRSINEHRAMNATRACSAGL